MSAKRRWHARKSPDKLENEFISIMAEIIEGHSRREWARQKLHELAELCKKRAKRKGARR